MTCSGSFSCCCCCSQLMFPGLQMLIFLRNHTAAYTSEVFLLSCRFLLLFFALVSASLCHLFVSFVCLFMSVHLSLYLLSIRQPPPPPDLTLGQSIRVKTLLGLVLAIHFYCDVLNGLLGAIKRTLVLCELFLPRPRPFPPNSL